MSELEKEEVRVHMSYWVFKNLLERAGQISREDARKISFTNYTGPFLAEQKKEVDRLFTQFVKEES